MSSDGKHCHLCIGLLFNIVKTVHMHVLRVYLRFAGLAWLRECYRWYSAYFK